MDCYVELRYIGFIIWPVTAVWCLWALKYSDTLGIAVFFAYDHLCGLNVLTRSFLGTVSCDVLLDGFKDLKCSDTLDTLFWKLVEFFTLYEEFYEKVGFSVSEHLVCINLRYPACQKKEVLG